MNHIPDQLFNLLENKSWQELNETEKIYVLKHLTEDEYINLHQLFFATQTIQKANHVEVPASIKRNLDKAFKKEHQKTLMIPLWQAAAVFLIVFGAMMYYTLNLKNIEKGMVQTIHDTLYVPQIVESKSKTIDTLVVYKYVENKQLERRERKSENVVRNISSNHMDMPVALIRTLDAEEIKSSLKRVKNKSMQEDTLYHKIGYASI